MRSHLHQQVNRKVVCFIVGEEGKQPVNAFIGAVGRLIP